MLLESSLPHASEHHSYLFQFPSQVLTATHGDDLPALFQTVEAALAAGLWAAGYVAYEAGAHFLGLPDRPSDSPLAVIGIYGQPQIFDHDAASRVADNSAPIPLSLALMPRITVSEYRQSIQQILNWIAAGDTYQLNYTTRLQSPCPHPALEVYNALRAQQRSSYAAVVHLEADRTVLSLSPELFFRVDEAGLLTTRPMKGTAHRSADPVEDARFAAALQHDEKNRAEHVMIVDLLRNDLNRICRTGTVAADDLFHVEQYSTVHQMTSRVSGSLRSGTCWYQVFRALFPGGSITGAPKRHTAELIAQVERQPRGVYTGAIGYFAPDRTACFNIAIRTAVLSPNEAAKARHPERSEAKRSALEEPAILSRLTAPPVTQTLTLGVGGGIVADSTATAEYTEALLKAAFVHQAASPVHLFETMRAQDGRIPLLEDHLKRITDSAEALGFKADPQALRDTVNRAVTSTQGTQRVRMELNRSGGTDVTISELSSWPAEVHLRMSHLKTEASSPHLRHKTTFRPEYQGEYLEAVSAGFTDALFVNTDGELTETCIANLLLFTGGRWYTPALSCGVLPGVLRSYLLKTGQIQEQPLTLEHLQSSHAVAVCNAIRGVAPVRLLLFHSGEVFRWTTGTTPLPSPPW